MGVVLTLKEEYTLIIQAGSLKERLTSTIRRLLKVIYDPITAFEEVYDVQDLTIFLVMLIILPIVHAISFICAYISLKNYYTVKTSIKSMIGTIALWYMFILVFTGLTMIMLSAMFTGSFKVRLGFSQTGYFYVVKFVILFILNIVALIAFIHIPLKGPVNIPANIRFFDLRTIYFFKYYEQNTIYKLHTLYSFLNVLCKVWYFPLSILIFKYGFKMDKIYKAIICGIILYLILYFLNGFSI